MVSYLDEGLNYALEIADEDADKIIEAFVSIYPELTESIMRAVRQIEERGIHTRSLKIARTMIQAGASIERVARWTGLSEASIRSL